MKINILILFFLPFLSFSQPVFFAGGEMAFWFDEESSNFGIGPSLGLNFILGQSPVSISGKTAIIYYPNANGRLTLPLLAGIKYDLDERRTRVKPEGLYIEGLGGFQIIRKNSNTDLSLGLTPKIGVVIKEKTDISVGMNVIIEDASRSQYLGFNLSYRLI